MGLQPATGGKARDITTRASSRRVVGVVEAGRMVESGRMVHTQTGSSSIANAMNKSFVVAVLAAVWEKVIVKP